MKDVFYYDVALHLSSTVSRPSLMLLEIIESLLENTCCIGMGEKLSQIYTTKKETKLKLELTV